MDMGSSMLGTIAKATARVGQKSNTTWLTSQTSQEEKGIMIKDRSLRLLTTKHHAEEF